MKLVSTYLLTLAVLMMSITGISASQAAPSNPFGSNDNAELYNSDSDDEDDNKATVPNASQPIYEDTDPEFFRLFVTGDHKKTDTSKQAPSRTITVVSEESKAAKQPRTLDTLVRAEDVSHLNLSADNEFKHGETVAVIRSSGDLKYAQIYAPEQINPELAKTITDYRIPAKDYLNVTCFLLSGSENFRQYPICSIFKIDPDTKEPAVCQLCKQRFTQQKNRLYPCGHMFHLTCIGNYKAEMHTLLTPGCPYCGPICGPECVAHQ